MNGNNQRRDLMGQKFNRLTAVRPDVNRHGRTYWVCRCECGNEKSVSTTHLLCNKTKSCGCALTEFLVGRSTHRATCDGTPDRRKHTAEYSAWSSLKNRCDSPDCPQYASYGGRGIRVCDRWSNRFEDFLTDMGPRPSPNHSIDRYPDNDGNYEPGNCRWATRKEQNRNRRSSLFLAAFGQALTLAEWSEKTGIDRQTIRQRLKHGWTAEKALGTPARPYGQSSVKIQTATPASSALPAHHHAEEPDAGAGPTVR